MSPRSVGELKKRVEGVLKIDGLISENDALSLNEMADLKGMLTPFF